MKLGLLIFLVVFSVLSANVYGYRTVFPCEQYSCFNVAKSGFECPSGLVPTRGWCTGPNNILMCGPPGMPTGPLISKETKEKIYSGALTKCGASESSSGVARTSDFSVTISGNTACKYRVENNGKITLDWTPVECDSEVIITVGSGGNCPESGECIVWSDGGLFGFTHQSGAYEVVTESTISCRRPYGDYQCMNVFSCTAKGGLPKSGFCPGPSNFQCCIIGGEISASSSLLYDNAFLITNGNQVKEILNNVFLTKNVRIVIETSETIGQDIVTLIPQKFKMQYQLNRIGIPGLNLLVLYGRKENRFFLGHAQGCGLDSKELEGIINDVQIRQFLDVSDYNSAFLRLSTLLKELVIFRDTQTVECSPRDIKISCAEACLGIFGSCSEDACKRAGCSFNKKYSICTDADVSESRISINERLNAVKNGFKGFIKNDPLCSGPNCAGYIIRVHDYIFGLGKHYITGISGNAWNMPAATREHGGTAKSFDWRSGEVFTDYDSLIPGDVIGFYYSDSDYLPNKKGGELGNTPEIDFTHAAMYLGRKESSHIITHLYHAPGASDPVRTEPLESFMRRYGDKFKVRYLMRPNQEALYRILPDSYKPDFKIVKIGQGTTLISLVPGSTDKEKEAYAWVTSNINSIVESFNPDSTPRTIRIPTTLPQLYEYEDISTVDPDIDTIVKALAQAIQERKEAGKIYPDSPLEWAKTIVANSPEKTPEYVAMMAALVEKESVYTSDPLSSRNVLGIEVSEGLIRNIDIFNLRSYSVGCMGVQLCKAEKTAQSLKISGSAYDSLRTRDGCVFYGGQYMENVRKALNIEPSAKLTDDMVLAMFAEHHRGEYFIRNAQVQIKLNDILGPDEMKKTIGKYSLFVDGKMLLYNKCNVNSDVSDTEKAIKRFVSVHNLPIGGNEIRMSLLLEKSPEFENTRIFKEIKRIWLENVGSRIEVADYANSIKSNKITVLRPSAVKISISPAAVGSGASYEIRSTANVPQGIAYHVITYKFFDSSGSLAVPETKADCGRSIQCSSLVVLPPGADGQIQYWADTGLNDGSISRDPAGGFMPILYPPMADAAILIVLRSVSMLTQDCALTATLFKATARGRPTYSAV